MTSPHDIIEVPWQPGVYLRRILVEALDAAGRPTINSGGRLKAEQQRFWDAFQNGTGSPADDPNRPDRFPLAHVRFVAADITPTAERVRRLKAAGLVRPYSYEEWHWELPNVYAYALVEALPTTAPTTIIDTPGEDIMRVIESPAYVATGQRVLIKDNVAKPVPAGWVQNLITHGRIPFASYPTNDMLTQELNMFYMMQGLDQAEADKATAKVVADVLDKAKES